VGPTVSGRFVSRAYQPSVAASASREAWSKCQVRTGFPGHWASSLVRVRIATGRTVISGPATTINWFGCWSTTLRSNRLTWTNRFDLSSGVVGGFRRCRSAGAGPVRTMPGFPSRPTSAVTVGAGFGSPGVGRGCARLLALATCALLVLELWAFRGQASGNVGRSTPRTSARRDPDRRAAAGLGLGAFGYSPARPSGRQVLTGEITCVRPGLVRTESAADLPCSHEKAPTEGTR